MCQVDVAGLSIACEPCIDDPEQVCRPAGTRAWRERRPQSRLCNMTVMNGALTKERATTASFPSPSSRDSQARIARVTPAIAGMMQATPSKPEESCPDRPSTSSTSSAYSDVTRHFWSRIPAGRPPVSMPGTSLDHSPPKLGSLGKPSQGLTTTSPSQVQHIVSCQPGQVKMFRVEHSRDAPEQNLLRLAWPSAACTATFINFRGQPTRANS